MNKGKSGKTRKTIYGQRADGSCRKPSMHKVRTGKTENIIGVYRGDVKNCSCMKCQQETPVIFQDRKERNREHSMEMVK